MLFLQSARVEVTGLARHPAAGWEDEAGGRSYISEARRYSVRPSDKFLD
jgi:hypothetical protein